VNATIFRTLVSCALATVAVQTGARAGDTERLLNDAKNFPSLRSFVLHIASDSPAEGPRSETLTYVAPDSLRVDVPSKNFSAVIIGSYLWVRRGPGRWHRAQLTDASNALDAVRATSSLAARIDGKRVRFLGDATLAGKTMRVYEIAGPPRGSLPPAKERIWIGVDDGYPHRIVQRDGAFVSTGTYSKFNQTFSVAQ
jgi:hypothetical protein